MFSSSVSRAVEWEKSYSAKSDVSHAVQPSSVRSDLTPGSDLSEVFVGRLTVFGCFWIRIDSDPITR